MKPTNEARQAFNRYALENGISLDNKDDWGPWWDCWLNGWQFAKKSEELSAEVEDAVHRQALKDAYGEHGQG